MISLASVNGPSVTVTLPPESRTRAPSAVGPRPPLPIIVPVFVSSSASLLIASINSLGGGPCLSACLTIIMNRIVRSPYQFLGPSVGSIHTSSVTLLIDKKTELRLFSRGNFFAQPLLLRPQLRRELLAEITRLKHRTNLDFRSAI